MSVYSRKGKGWRYDFTLNGQRYSGAWHKKKKEAQKAEHDRRREVLNPPEKQETPIDMVFLELVNRRLDHVKAYNSERHYTDHRYQAVKWTAEWGNLLCSQISADMIQHFILERSRVSSATANKELRMLRATFNFGRKRKWVSSNPTEEIDFLPVIKTVRVVPTPEQIDRVISVASADTQDCLIAIRETMARVGEINRLTWKDVSLEEKYVVLSTRKKRGGHLTPRKVPLTRRLFEALSGRFRERDP